jgi:AraC-like DNA-binding protein
VQDECESWLLIQINDEARLAVDVDHPLNGVRGRHLGNDSATRSRSTISPTARISTSSTCVAPFGAQVGMPPHRYLTHLRIARAKELLARSVRASDVAPLVGLYDQAQLTRHFRRLVGTTPALYGRRRRHANALDVIQPLAWE